MRKMDNPNYGLREDRTPKGKGFFGELKRPDKKVSTELSISVNFDGKEELIPTLVPTLTKQEVDYLLSGGKPTKEIVDKAVKHAVERKKQGKGAFIEEGEEVSPQYKQFQYDKYNNKGGK